MIQGKILACNEDLSEAYAIRINVFVEELGGSQELEFDDMDKEAMHAIVYDKQKTVAAGRISFDGECCLIEKIAVLKDYRRKKYGDFIVRMLLNRAFTTGIKEVTVIADLSTEAFFRNIGFVQKGESIAKSEEPKFKMCIHSQDVKTMCCKK